MVMVVEIDARKKSEKNYIKQLNEGWEERWKLTREYSWGIKKFLMQKKTKEKFLQEKFEEMTKKGYSRKLIVDLLKYHCPWFKPPK